MLKYAIKIFLIILLLEAIFGLLPVSFQLDELNKKIDKVDKHYLP